MCSHSVPRLDQMMRWIEPASVYRMSSVMSFHLYCIFAINMYFNYVLLFAALVHCILFQPCLYFCYYQCNYVLLYIAFVVIAPHKINLPC